MSYVYSALDLSMAKSRSSTRTGNRQRKRTRSYTIRCLLLSPAIRSDAGPRDVDLPSALVSALSCLVDWFVGWLVAWLLSLRLCIVTVAFASGWHSGCSGFGSRPGDDVPAFIKEGFLSSCREISRWCVQLGHYSLLQHHCDLSLINHPIISAEFLTA